MSDPQGRYVGITVLGDFILSEGVEGVLENVTAAGATAVALNPTVTAEAAEGEGSFQPPDDAGTSPRLFDRPLFGKRSLWVQSEVSFEPDASLYTASSYTPRVAGRLTAAHGSLIGEFIDAARGRELDVFLQVPAARPSGLQDEDRPRLPGGELCQGRMADTASLASPAVREWNRCYTADLLRQYPAVSGFRIDWPEYPCYTWGEVFQDFGIHVENWAGEHGFGFPQIEADVLALKEWLETSLADEDLAELADRDRGRFRLGREALARPGVVEWLRLKAALSVDLVRDWREAIDAVNPAKQLMSHAFMPPWTLVTGLDFAGVAEYSEAVSPKLYTMHWAQMVTFWGNELMARRPGLDERLLVRALISLLDMFDGTPEDPGGESLADYRYPEPDEPHPVSDSAQRRKIAQATAAVGGRAEVYPLVHGYGPDDDFHRRLKIVADSPAAGVWINRYGYLGDPKLASIGQLFGSGAVEEAAS
jgi:hypothetical protein